MLNYMSRRSHSDSGSRGSSSSSSCSSSSSVSSNGAASNSSSPSPRNNAPNTSAHAKVRSVPLETVRQLLIGSLDPIELAREILPASDIAAVVEYNSAPYRPPLDLKRHDIRTVEDVLFVGLSYVGFEGRLNVRPELKQARFVAHYKLIPQTMLDVWYWFNGNDEDGIDFKRLLYTVNFLKLCKCMCAIFCKNVYLCLSQHLVLVLQ